MRKLLFFDYFISQLISFITSETFISGDIALAVKNNIDRANLNKLKLLKLLFLVSTIKEKDKYLLDDVFDNFYAMPYGPVESDIYDNLESLPNYRFINNTINVKTNASFKYSNIDFDKQERIKQSIKKLHELNFAIFSMSAFELVELTHKSESWQIIYSEANRKGRLSLKMPNELIKGTVVFYK